MGAARLRADALDDWGAEVASSCGVSFLPGLLLPGAGMNSENSIAQRLRAARRRAGFASAAAAARAFGWSEVTYRAHENGLRGIRSAVAEHYAARLNVSLAWLLTGEGRHPRRHHLDIAGEVGDGGSVRPRLRAGPPRAVFSVETPVAMSPQAIGFRIAGTALQPRYDPGDIVVCDRTGDSPRNLIGREAVVITSQGRGYLRIVRKVMRSGLVDLQSVDGHVTRAVHVAWSAAVTSVVRSRRG